LLDHPNIRFSDFLQLAGFLAPCYAVQERRQRKGVNKWWNSICILNVHKLMLDFTTIFINPPLDKLPIIPNLRHY
jgi:hypothetical protein